MVTMSERIGGPTGPGASTASAPMDAYDYPLPEAAIAQRPVEPRCAARLLVGPGLSDAGSMGHATVADLPSLLGPGDLVVVNDTRVLPARLSLRKASGGRAEVLLLEPLGADVSRWQALVRPGRRLPDSSLLYEHHAPEDAAPVVEVGPGLGDDDGRREVRLLDPGVVERSGAMPLPPYIHETLDDPERYQTVYAEARGLEHRSTAAPTAGLHFTRELLADCVAAGRGWPGSTWPSGSTPSGPSPPRPLRST